MAARFATAVTALALLAAVVAGGAQAAPGGGRALAPPGFFGVVPQAPLSETDWRRVGSLDLSVRVHLDWPEIEPEPGRFEWAGVDATVAAAAAQGASVMPVIFGTPSWLAPEPADPPLGPTERAEWQGFLRTLVGRYGPDGSFWLGQAHPDPIRRWQVWNEPNYPVFWQPVPSPTDYVHLLQLSSAAIRGADPKATVVAAGLAPIEHQPPPWKFLQAMYAVRGARRAFDAAALHPYANTIAGLVYSVSSARRVMALAGDGRKPLYITELGVSSAGGTPFDLGPAGQAGFLAGGLGRLAAQRRHWHLGGVFWFTWADSGDEDPSCAFCGNSGLFDAEDRPKPAWSAMQRVVSRWQRRQGVQ